MTQKIRTEIWVKILGNVAFNPISALTGATLAQMARDPEVRHVVRNIMLEVEALAAKMGIEIYHRSISASRARKKIGEHKTSMLRDLEAGRPMELEAVVGAVVELGERLAVPMPYSADGISPWARLLGAHFLSVGVRCESLVSFSCGGGRDDHDRELSIRLDFVRQTLDRRASRTALEAVRRGASLLDIHRLSNLVDACIGLGNVNKINPVS